MSAGHLSRARGQWSLRPPELTWVGTSPSAVQGPTLTMGSGTSEAVIVFVKYPTPGAVKTRLAADVGPVAATQLYRACAEHTLRAACRYGYVIPVPLRRMSDVSTSASPRAHLLPHRCPGAEVTVAYAPLDKPNDHTIEHQMRLWLDPIQRVSFADRGVVVSSQSIGLRCHECFSQP